MRAIVLILAFFAPRLALACERQFLAWSWEGSGATMDRSLALDWCVDPIRYWRALGLASQADHWDRAAASVTTCDPDSHVGRMYDAAALLELAGHRAPANERGYVITCALEASLPAFQEGPVRLSYEFFWHKSAVDRASALLHFAAHDRAPHLENSACVAGASCDRVFGEDNAQTIEIQFLEAAVAARRGSLPLLSPAARLESAQLARQKYAAHFAEESLRELFWIAPAPDGFEYRIPEKEPSPEIDEATYCIEMLTEVSSLKALVDVWALPDHPGLADSGGGLDRCAARWCLENVVPEAAPAARAACWAFTDRASGCADYFCGPLEEDPAFSAVLCRRELFEKRRVRAVSNEDRCRARWQRCSGDAAAEIWRENRCAVPDDPLAAVENGEPAKHGVCELDFALCAAVERVLFEAGAEWAGVSASREPEAQYVMLRRLGFERFFGLFGAEDREAIFGVERVLRHLHRALPNDAPPSAVAARAVRARADSVEVRASLDAAARTFDPARLRAVVAAFASASSPSEVGRVLDRLP